MPKAKKFSVVESKGAFTIRAKGPIDALAFACAAHAMIGKAHVALGKSSVWLLPKASAKVLAGEFEARYAEQAALWRALRAGKKAREAQRARVLALAAPAAPAAEIDFGELPPERKAEIAALLAEPPVDDKFNIRGIWAETRKR